MSSGTLARVFYRVRPAKNVERKMICEALAVLNRVEPLVGYQYVGLGSLEFHDFALFYQRLGVGAMVSMEKRDSPAERRRVRFNRPYGHIAIKWGPSGDRLPEIGWGKRSIVWLDYDDCLKATMLEDIQLVVSQLRSGSCLIVTVCCESRSAKTSGCRDNEDATRRLANARLDDLRDNVGAERIPEGVGGSSLLRKWGLADASHRIVKNEIEAVLAGRNAPLSQRSRLRYAQIFNFNYADSRTKMASFGGVLMANGDEDTLSESHFEHLAFYRPGQEAYEIKIPRLSVKEARWLNQMIPRGVTRQTMIPQEHVDQYRPLHKYFPEFLEVESG